jgi:uncharacterized protein (TIGR02145 family)
MKKKSIFFNVLIIFLLNMRYPFSQNSQNIKSECIVDTIHIEKQIWMSKNLDVCIFQNGDTISEIQSLDEWIKAGKAGKPAWCYYNNDTLMGKVYGKLYNWYAVSDTRCLAPKGYRLPTEQDFVELAILVKKKAKLAGFTYPASIFFSKKYWGWGNDILHFNALPGGSRWGQRSSLWNPSEINHFYGEGRFTGFWSSSQSKFKNYAISLLINEPDTPDFILGSHKFDGLYVRCIVDNL